MSKMALKGAAAAPAAPAAASDFVMPDFNIDGERQDQPASRFSCVRASDMTLSGIRPGGTPDRSVFDTAKLGGGTGLFRLAKGSLSEVQAKTAELIRKAEAAKAVEDRVAARNASPFQGGTQAVPAQVPAAQTQSDFAATRTSLTGTPPEAMATTTGMLPTFGVPEPKKSRAQRYFEIMMHKQKLRLAEDARLAAEEQKAQAAQKALRAKTMALEQLSIAERKNNQDLLDDLDEDEPDPKDKKKGKKKKKNDIVEDEGELELEPYDGTFKLELEFVVYRAPGEYEIRKTGDGDFTPPEVTPREEVEEEVPEEREDFAADLENLKNELEDIEAKNRQRAGKVKAKEQAQAREKRVAGGKRLKNIFDNPVPEWTLRIAGSVFFVPDVERYAFQPSFPPPPPASESGRHRVHLKPRLPLDISNQRYKDEHPQIWPDQEPNSIDQKLLKQLEERLMAFDLYTTCSESVGRSIFAARKRTTSSKALPPLSPSSTARPRRARSSGALRPGADATMRPPEETIPPVSP